MGKVKSNTKKRTVNSKKILTVFFILLTVLLTFFINKIINKNSSFKVTPEILRSREYDVVQTGDERTDSEYVLFDAFFLKDLDGDGNADSIRGTCNEVGKEATLYMDLKVINTGHFKEGQIKINSINFNLATTLVKDQIIAQNYISNDTKIIKLNDIQNGNQKLITGILKANIGNDTTKYSKINSITLTGTHVDDNGTETKINKTINFTVDWYGTTKAYIESKNVNNEVDELNQLLKENNVKLQFDLKTYESKNQLILKSSNIEGTIPNLNGYKPTLFVLEGDNIVSTYDAETGKFTAKREAQLNERQEVVKKAETMYGGTYRYNIYTIKLTYPREAYENMEGNDIELLIPIKTWYEGYNNENSEFENPHISNIDETTVVARWVKYSGNAYRLDVSVGNYETMYNNNEISKEKPLKIYNNLSKSEKEDFYIVQWNFSTGKEKKSEGIILKETKNGSEQVSDQFIKKDSSQESMEDLTTNIGIFFIGSSGMLGENGWIKVYNDETNELIETFTKDNWNQYNKDEPYYYKNGIKHIRVETSATNSESSFKVCNKKELDDKYITKNYTREEFDKLEHIKSTLTCYYGEDSSTVNNSALYQAPYSLATIELSKDKTSVQETIYNQIIKITTRTNVYNQKKWKNGIFLVEIPKEIIAMKINSVTSSNNNVAIIGYDLYEEDEKYCIKIITANEIEEKFVINIDCNMTPDPNSTTVSRTINLYATNENCMNYYYQSRDNDKYDINENSNIDEIINYTETNISIISPNELITTQIASNYDDKNNITIAPKVAIVEKNQRTADIEIYFTNNYNQDITDVVLQGVIPFEHNQYVVGNQPLDSTYSTWMSNTGINIPNELKQYATIYYSTEEKPTNDLTNPSNKWQKADQITDWNNIKTYIIDFGEHKFKNGEKYKFTYQVNLPEDTKYNDVTYSEHGIYFSILTDAGKYSTYTAANKLGLMIAKQYDLEIEKLQERTDKRIQGVTFKITEEGQNESKIKATDNNGKLIAKGLFDERSYIIQEIKTAEDYVLKTEEIKIYTYIDEQDNLYIKYKNEDGSYSNLEDKYSWLKNAIAEKNEKNDYKAKLTLENEVKLKLKLIKVEEQSNNKISGVLFNVKGEDINKTISTDSKGEVTINGLYKDKEYEITETRQEGYYLLNPIKFKIINNNETYSAQIIQGNVKEQNVDIIDFIPQLNLTIENEKIPTYKLEIVKFEEKHEEKKLKNVEFLLKGEDDKSQKRFITNAEGKITIDDLYQFVNGKDITGKYTLIETKAPSGYSSNNEEISFVVSKNGEGKLEANIDNQGNLTLLKNVEIDNNTIKLTIQNKPLFKLTKTDKETGAKIKGAKFIIYELEEDGTETDFAKDINGNYVGTLNSKNQYEVITDENGEITLPLRNGAYKAIEIEAPKGYEKTPVEEIFKITGNESNEEIGTPDEYNNTLEINYIEDLVDFSENVRNGNTYAGTKVILKRTLDFTDSNSYRDSSNTQTYGDYNFDGNIDSIKTELTTGIGFRPIGEYSINLNNNHPFSGIFDGQNNEINGIHIDQTAETPAKPDNFNINNSSALFSSAKDAKIKKIGINGKIKGETYTSGLISYADNTEIYSCYNNCSIEGTSTHQTGILGEGKNNITIENCYNNGNLLGTCTYTAGILGQYNDTNGILIVKSCYNNSTNLGSLYSAGIVGSAYSKNIDIENCNNYGNFMGNGFRKGGIISSLSAESAKINGCINYGNINCTRYVGGIISDSLCNNLIISNCINYGNIYGDDGNGAGGIIGIGSGITEKCINYGNIESINGESHSLGGIKGEARGIAKECANYGTIKGKKEIGGIGCYVDTIENCYNTGDIYIYSTNENVNTGGLSGINNAYVKNSYTTCKIYSVNSRKYNSLYSLTGSSENITNSYYLYDVSEITTNSNNTTGTQVSEEELGSREFYNRLNVDNVWLYRENESPVLKMPATNAKEISELNFSNIRKKFNITTDVKEFDNTKGGTISGEDEAPYEEVKASNDSTKEIKIVPDDGYKIFGITINGEKYEFTPKQDRTYTLPNLENIQEDKHIVVTFAKEEQILTINKVDKNTRETLTGAEFKIERKDNILNKLLPRAQYYFPHNNETEQNISDNKNKDGTYACSYIYFNPLKNGKYYIELNARISSEEGKDIGYATISKGSPTNEHGNDTNIWEFMNISGEVENTTYKSDVFEYEGREPFFLNVIYTKDAENSVGEDALFINSIKLCCDKSEAIKETTDSNGQINVALEQGDYEITETKAPDEYVLNQEPIEITFDSNNKTLTIENESKAKINVNHYLWTETDGTTTKKVADSEKFFGDLGKDYSTSPNFKIEYEIIRNKDFYKGKSQNEILSILEKNSIQEAGYESWDEFDNDYYIPQNASGQFSDTTQVIDYYYKSKTYTLTVKHLLEGTEKNVPSKTDETVKDEVTEGLNKNEDYSTEKSNNVDYTKYVLVDKSDNFEGQIESDTVVRYYYRLKDTTGVIVHHYIVGTENKVPAKTEGMVDNEILPETGTAKVGDEYETSNASNKIAKNFKVATNKDVYGDNIPAELEGKENELYTPENATGTFKDEVQEVTYYYVLKTSNQTNSISKTGPESISTEDEKVTYNITYNVAIQEYIGDATVQIVDTLPYKIDITKSSLKGGEYNDEDKTITWKDLIKDIDTYTNPETGNISISKKISVVYKDIDHSKKSMTNKVSGSTKLLTSNVTTDVVEDTAVTNYSFSNSNPEDNPNNPDNPNDPTNPTNPDPNVNPQNPDAPSEDNKIVVKSTKIEKGRNT